MSTDSNIPTMSIKVGDFLNLILSIKIEDIIVKITKLIGKKISLYNCKSISETLRPTPLKSFFWFINSIIFRDSRLENNELIFI